MVQRIGGSRRKSRHKFKKSYKDKGKSPLRKHLQEFDEGDKVLLNADTSVQGGIYHARYHGKTGKVVGEQGSCYKVEVKDGNSIKKFILHPVHLRKIE